MLQSRKNKPTKAGILVEPVKAQFIPSTPKMPPQYHGFQDDDEPETLSPSPYIEQREDDVEWDEDSARSNMSIQGDDEDAHNDCGGGSANPTNSKRPEQIGSLLLSSPTNKSVAEARFLWKRFIRYIKRFARPRVPVGYERLEWTCVSTKYPQCPLTHGNRIVETRCTVTIEMITLSP